MSSANLEKTHTHRTHKVAVIHYPKKSDAPKDNDKPQQNIKPVKSIVHLIPKEKHRLERELNQRDAEVEELKSKIQNLEKKIEELRNIDSKKDLTIATLTCELTRAIAQSEKIYSELNTVLQQMLYAENANCTFLNQIILQTPVWFGKQPQNLVTPAQQKQKN